MANKLETRKVGNLDICPMVNGLWQLGNGSVGDSVTNDDIVNAMLDHSNAGLFTFDGADHYGDAEIVMGLHKIRNESDMNRKRCIYFTKWVPDMDIEISYKNTENAIDYALKRMKTNQLDMLQFHWWDYKDNRYIKVLQYLMKLQKIGKINNLSLTNFNTKYLMNIYNNIDGINIASNQIPYSLIDLRVEKNMIKFCELKNIKLLTYGTLLGGFLSNKYLNTKKPIVTSYKMSYGWKRPNSFETESLNKYYPWIMAWSNNNWDLFQKLLKTLKNIGDSYNASISQIAIKYILDKPCVAGVLIGCRFGVTNHINSNIKILNIKLTKDDKKLIESVVNQGRPLMGDVGDEYRGSKL